MKDYVAFHQDDGAVIVVEVNEDDHDVGLSRVGRREDGIILDSGRRFEEMLETARPVAAAVLKQMRSGVDTPSEISLEFGLKLTFSAGAVIASSSGEGTFKINLVWKRNDPQG